MIVLYLKGQTLADREALSMLLDRPASTIRARCEPVASDIKTRRALYDAAAVEAAMSNRRRRRPRKIEAPLPEPDRSDHGSERSPLQRPRVCA